MKYVKKTITGYKEVDIEEADSVILEIEEYDNMIYEIEDTKKEYDDYISSLEDSHKRKMTKLSSDYRYEIDSLQRDLDAYISSYNKQRAELAEVKENLADEVYLNENLKRIARERANAARKITPKKNHDGYIVLISKQWKTKKFGETFWVWKNIVQTPIPVALSYDIAEKFISEEFINILYELGCDDIYVPEDEDIHNIEEFCNLNRMFDMVYNANYKSGFWEVEFFTTKSIEVPDFRRKNAL